MKSIKCKAIVTIAALSLFIAVPAALAGNGNRPGNGSGPIHNITDGDSVVITGEVTSVGTKGNGIEIETGSGSETTTVYGIGPVGFWGAEEIERPAVGDEITVNGYKVTLPDDSTKIISGSINNGEQEITLRDPESGAPLWRGGVPSHEFGRFSTGGFGKGGGLKEGGRLP